MAEIKWIKITTDIFDDEKIKVIEKMPEGDTMLVIWLKLLTLAGKKNNHGMVYLTDNIPYTPEILSDIFNRESRLISLALNTFVSFGMVEIENDIISVLNWDKHQNIEGMEKIRKQNRVRQAKYRQRKQLEHSNVTSRDSNGTEENRLLPKGSKSIENLDNIESCSLDAKDSIKLHDIKAEMLRREYSEIKQIYDEIDSGNEGEAVLKHWGGKLEKAKAEAESYGIICV